MKPTKPTSPSHGAEIRPYIRQFYRGNRLLLALALVASGLSTLANLVISYILQQVTDLIAGNNALYTLIDLLWLSVLFLLILALSFLFGYFSRPRFYAKGMAQYKNYVYEQLSQKNISAFSGENTSLYISALSNDATSIENNYLGNTIPLIGSLLNFVSALAMMYYYSPALTLSTIALALLPLGVAMLVGNCAVGAEKNVSEMNHAYLSTLKDGLNGFSVVKSFRAEKQMCRLFAESVKRLANAKENRTKITILVQMLSECAGVTTQLGVFLAGAYFALNGKGITAGTVIVFVQLVNSIINPIAQIPQYLSARKSAKALIQKLADALSENVREEGNCEKITLHHGITLQDVSFAYEAEKPVLQNINFTFEAGKSYAIVGASGSGKSTLLNLLLASHAEYQGKILYDEVDLKTIRSADLYDMTAVIQQNVFLFNTSLRDNITMFSAFPKEEVDRAIALSGLSSLIAERGEQYLCGENGNGLSGGEKQRVSIARSLLKKSQVLLVDEATAALDAQTASQVSNAILNLRGMTRIVVTHTLEETLLKRYDHIVALKNGSITETGTFDELMEQKGYFYSLFTVSQ